MLRKIRRRIFAKVFEDSHKSLLLSGKLASERVRSKQYIRTLEDVEFRVFSQWGEDGIIDWLVEKLDLTDDLKKFVEFGVQSYTEANTRFLLENRNWRGLILDGDPTLESQLKAEEIYWRYDLTAKSHFITRENINDLIARYGFTGEIGLLSVDIDGNDYWVWEALTVISPILVICEYNSIFGNKYPISIPYDSEFVCSRAHYTYQYFGASINAMCSLAEKKGYTFLGTTSAGNDAFFIRNDYAERILSTIETVSPSVMKARTSRNQEGNLSFLPREIILKEIGNLPVVDVTTGDSLFIRDLKIQ